MFVDTQNLRDTLAANVCCCSVAVFHGHVNSTFYVKAVLSPDDKYLLSGSSDGNSYVWQVSRPQSSAHVLRGHVNEVTLSLIHI